MPKVLFKPGQSGNPKGRPKGSINKRPGEYPVRNARQSMQEAVLRAREATPEAVAKLVSLMRHGDEDKVKLAAAVAILDRGLGKPTQPVDVSLVKQIGQMSLDELIELEAKIASLPMAMPALIEHQPEQHQDTVAEPISALSQADSLILLRIVMPCGLLGRLWDANERVARHDPPAQGRASGRSRA